MPTEVAFTIVHVLVLRHQRNGRLRGKMGELTVPIPQTDWHKEEVDPSEPQQKLPLVFSDHDSSCALRWVKVEDPSTARVPTGQVSHHIQPPPYFLLGGLLGSTHDRRGGKTRPASLGTAADQAARRRLRRTAENRHGQRHSKLRKA